MAKAEARMDAANDRADTLFAIICELNGAGVLDNEGNPLSHINVLQGVRRLIATVTSA